MTSQDTPFTPQIVLDAAFANHQFTGKISDNRDVLISTSEVLRDDGQT